MEQHQFKFSLSLGSKLLISIVGLLFITFALIMYATAPLLEENQRVQTFRILQTESALIGREFTDAIQQGLVIARAHLDRTDGGKSLSLQKNSTLKSASGDATLLGVRVGTLNTQTGALQISAPGASDESDEKKLGEPEKLTIETKAIKLALPQLKKLGIYIFNISKIGRSPTVAIAVLKGSEESNSSPVAISYLSLKNLSSRYLGSDVIITNRKGWVLFSTRPADLHRRKNIFDDSLFELAYVSKAAIGGTDYELNGQKYFAAFAKPANDLIVLSKAKTQTVQEISNIFTQKITLIAGMMIGLSMIIFVVLSSGINNSIAKLNDGVKKIAQGAFDIKIGSRRLDSLGSLIRSFDVMTTKINEMFHDRIRKTNIENQIALVSTVQQSLLPSQNFENEFMELKGLYKSAQQCKGDWWGYFYIRGKMCLLMTDTSGQGINSALITATLQSYFSIMRKLAEDTPNFNFSPGSMLAYANRAIFDAAEGRTRATAFCTVIDFNNYSLSYANAAHNPAWLFRKAGKDVDMKSLTVTGPQLGEQRDLPKVKEKMLDLAQGDTLALYTDGLLQAANAAGEAFGKKRLLEVIEGNLGADAKKIVNMIYASFTNHTGPKPIEDDVTLAVAKIRELTSDNKS